VQQAGQPHDLASGGTTAAKPIRLAVQEQVRLLRDAAAHCPRAQ
jgi:hypothetical protein